MGICKLVRKWPDLAYLQCIHFSGTNINMCNINGYLEWFDYIVKKDKLCDKSIIVMVRIQWKQDQLCDKWIL